jgi:glycosyltransferase involved in cell wall biosynthesis
MGLKALGDRVIIFCRPESRIGAKARSLGIEVRTHPLRSTRDVTALACVMKLIKKEGVDVVSTHSGVDSFIVSLAGRLSRRKPAIVRTRHLALPITSKSSYSVFPMKVVTVSEYVRRHLVEEKGVAGKKVVSIPTGIDLRRFDPVRTPDTFRTELGVGPEVPVVGTIAILRRKKGHHVLLDAIPEVLREVPEARFVFAGDGPQRHNIETKIRTMGLGESVTLLGLRGDVPAVLKGLDLFVLPTVQEALGTSILEASAMGRAVVATRAGGTPEVVAEEKTGLLVPPEDSHTLAAAIIRLLKDRPLRESMGREGRKLVEADFSTDRMVEKMHALYHR